MECTTVADLCSFFVGDTLDYDFVFKKEDGTPINISGMVLTLTMKINKSDSDNAQNALQNAVTFPDDDRSTDGNGDMYVDAKLTGKLLFDRWYQFDFQLKSGGHSYTVGTGRVFVKQRVRIA